MVASSKDNALTPMPVLDHLKVRLATREDASTIASFSAAMALETEGRRLDPDRLYDGTIALLEFPDRGFFMVAELEQADDHQLLGQLMITYEWSDWRNAVFWWIQSVYVDPAWRRQRVFRRMHETVMAIRKDESERLRDSSVRRRKQPRCASSVPESGTHSVISMPYLKSILFWHAKG